MRRANLRNNFLFRLPYVLPALTVASLRGRSLGNPPALILPFTITLPPTLHPQHLASSPQAAGVAMPFATFPKQQYRQ